MTSHQPQQHWQQQNNPQWNNAHPSKPQKKKGILKPVLIAGAALIAAIAIFGIAIIAIMYGRENTTIDACKERVVESAKYPGSANFLEPKTETIDGADIGWHVSGLVDFSNGFGNPVRHTYYCTGIAGLTGDVQIDDEKVIVLEGDWLP